MRFLALFLLLFGCHAADVLPGGGAPQRAIEGAVVQILGLRADFNRYTTLHQQSLAAQPESAARLRAMMEALIDESKKARLAYRGRLIETARTYAPDTLKAALEAVVARYAADEAVALIAPARRFVDQALAYQKDGVEQFDRWYAELLQ
jgi:hypothetical protein